MKNFDKLIFLLLVLYRLLSVYFVQTSFVPDEYWQSLEVAHKLEFGYGYLTWEWRKAIRSCVYPKLISVIYKLLPDNIFVLITVPRIFQAVLSSIGDYYTVKLATKVFGYQAGKWSLMCILNSWFLFYCASRTLTNMAETSFTACGLYLYPWKKLSSGRVQWAYLWMVGCSILMRPTAAVFWLPFCIWHLWRDKKEFISIMSRMLLVGIISLAVLVMTDYTCYGHWVLTPYQFFIFNWTNNIGAFYGSHPWHWYFSIGLPVVLSVQTIPVVLGFQLKKTHSMFFFIFFYVIVLSMLSHKEFRFLLPVLPLCLCISGVVLSEIESGRISLRRWKLSSKMAHNIALVTTIVNLPLALYMGLVHQKGTLDAINFLSKSVSHHSRVLFLLPCHSTPFYSHIHKTIFMKFLTCEPNFNNEVNYEDEADQFYKDPKVWLSSYLKYSDRPEPSSESLLPSHIVIFSNLYEVLSDVLHKYKYDLCFSAMHTHFTEKKIAEEIHVYCKR